MKLILEFELSSLDSNKRKQQQYIVQSENNCYFNMKPLLFGSAQ